VPVSAELVSGIGLPMVGTWYRGNTFWCQVPGKVFLVPGTLTAKRGIRLFLSNKYLHRKGGGYG
ncbi:hypothetical protein, partial [Halobacillus sp. BBL2006]|uniref:hypothetical protein n=1 Tax=Halobacillus sp. BBL2006 TaxID=1543706 RepID=UPI001E501B4B